MINENQLKLSEINLKLKFHINKTLFEKEEFNNAIVINTI